MIDKRENVLQLNVKKQPQEVVNNIDRTKKTVSTVKKATNTVPCEKAVETVKKVVSAQTKSIKEYKVLGKYKKKMLLFKSVSADVLDYACKLYKNDNITEVIESALIAGIKENDEKLYKSLIEKLHNEGGKII